jgi:hypothetical protein
MPIFLSEIQNLCEQPEREFETVIDLDEMADAGVRSVEFIEGEMESRAQAKERQREAAEAQLASALTERDQWMVRYQISRGAREASEAQLVEANAAKESAHNALREAEGELLQVCAELDEATARAEKAEGEIADFRRWLDKESAFLSKDDLVATLMERAEQAEAQLAEAAARASAFRIIAERLWEKVNDWRVRLIQWKIAGDASGRDLAELAELQKLADDYINVMAPLPIKEMEAYMRAHGIEIPDEQEGGVE